MTYHDGTGRYPPPLMHGEGEPTALLMQIILDFCGGDGILRSFTDEGGDPDALYSYDQASYADAMIALHESGAIEITKQDGARIWAKVLPEGRALIDSLRAAQERNEAASWRHRPAIINIDWSQCADVESVPDRCSGAWVVKDTRVMVSGILDNAEAGCSAEEIATEIFPSVTLDQVRRILDFARR
jgi:uncharacterized protein (DUF433 family)